MRETRQDFYDNGNLRSSIQYEGELMDGVAEYYYYNGRIKCRIPYEKGNVVDCNVPVLDEDGAVFRTDIWRNGKCRVYNIAGSLIGEFSLFNGNSQGDERWYNNDGTLRETCTCVNGKYEGLRKFYYGNGQVRQQECFFNDMRQGETVSFYENGKIHSTTPYVNDKAEGVAKLYNENGTLCAERRFANDKLNGPATYFYEDGSIRLRANYKDNLMHGEYCAYWENGFVRYKMQYNEGLVVDGDVECLDKDGNVRNVEHWEGGHLIIRFESGAIRKDLPYFNGSLQGNAKVFFENGELESTAFFQNGDIEGTELAYFENGALESITPYVHGYKNGIGKKFYRNGMLRCETTYNNGLANGTEKMWSKEGQLIWQNFYVDGSECGCKYYRYYDSGKLFSEIEMTGGLPNGTEKAYYENGALTSKMQYKDGMVIDGEYKLYDDSGKAKFNIVWKNNVGRAHFEDGSLRFETFNYRDVPNGHYQENNEDGEVLQDIFMFNGEPCDSFQEFLDNTFDTLAEDCEAFFSSAVNESEEDRIVVDSEGDRAGLWRERFNDFFRNCYEKIMENEGRDSNAATDWCEQADAYDNYEELKDFPHDSRELTNVQFIQKVVREFILRLRLPNDGLTELNIAEELQYLVSVKQ